jgi:hypothetical protein
MTKKNPEPAPDPRKPYRKPEVTQVVLRPDEAVLGSCKTNATKSGPAQPRCWFPSSCSSIGS